MQAFRVGFTPNEDGCKKCCIITVSACGLVCLEQYAFLYGLHHVACISHRMFLKILLLSLLHSVPSQTHSNKLVHKSQVYGVTFG